MNASEDWRLDRQDEDIKRLKERLYEAENKIRELERQPLEWLLKAEVWLIWIFNAALWIFVIVEAANRHS